MFCIVCKCELFLADRWCFKYIFQSLMTMHTSCFAFRHTAHFLRPVIRHIPSSVVSASPFIFSRHTHTRSASSFFHLPVTIVLLPGLHTCDSCYFPLIMLKNYQLLARFLLWSRTSWHHSTSCAIHYQFCHLKNLFFICAASCHDFVLSWGSVCFCIFVCMCVCVHVTRFLFVCFFKHL